MAKTLRLAFPMAGSRYLPGPPADVEDVPLLIHQHRRRGVTPQYQLLRLRLEIEMGFALR